MHTVEIYKEIRDKFLPDFEQYWTNSAINSATRPAWETTLKFYIKRMLLMVDSRFTDKHEIKRITDSLNDTVFYFSPEHLEEIYQAAVKISEGKKRGDVVSVPTLKGSVMKLYREKFDEGVTLNKFPEFSRYYRYAAGQLNIITGIPSHGKSEFLDMLISLWAEQADLKIALFSPENYPKELHIVKFLSKFTNKPFYAEGKMTEEDIETAMQKISNNIFFLEPHHDDVSLEAILSLVLEAKNQHGISAFVIDPWNELESNIPTGKTEVQYIGECLTKIRRFGRTNKITPFIVAHPTKLLPKNVGDPFPVPTAYNINGGAMWYNKADNILTVYRNDNDTVSVYIQKIKFKQYGKKGKVDFIYDFKTGMYREMLDPLPF